MTEVEQLLLQLADLRRLAGDIESEILGIQKACKHDNKATERERDSRELRYYDRHKCPDCNKIWYKS